MMLNQRRKNKMLKEIKLLTPVTCKEDESAIEVAKKLKDSLQRHIFVIDAKGFPIGIISTTDINNKVVAAGKDAAITESKEIMTQPIEVYNTEEDAVQVYKEMMNNKRLSCVIVEGSDFKGVFTLNRLINYITFGGE